MVILLRGSPYKGVVTLSVYGPFHTEEEAVDYGVKEWEGNPEWFVMEVIHPDDFNEESFLYDGDAPGELVDVPVEELERIIAESEARRRKPLKKEIMIDLSGIKE